jgi:hypothetical protein
VCSRTETSRTTLFTIPSDGECSNSILDCDESPNGCTGTEESAEEFECYVQDNETGLQRDEVPDFYFFTLHMCCMCHKHPLSLKRYRT